ncbi:MAG: phosphatase PAP2 family protein [Candidatus Dasytiphilus stammeri]
MIKEVEYVNIQLFNLIKANYNSPPWLILLATYLAKYLIYLIPCIFIRLWCWEQHCLYIQRQFLIKTIIAISLALLSSWMISKIIPYARPFTILSLGQLFIPYHIKNDSLPSNHGIIIFTSAIAFICWYSISYGIVLFLIGSAIAWARIYLWLHWPLDMIISLIIGIICCLLSQYIWIIYGTRLFIFMLFIYRYFFRFVIRRGWVKY